jgi:hypothetical protein
MKINFFRSLFKNPNFEQSKKYDYAAFISYKHAQHSLLVTKFISALKNYAKPLFTRPIKIFRDEDHLIPGLDLPQLIREKLASSEFLILLATPGAALSPWVHDELKIWCGDLKRAEKIVIVILDGTISIKPDTKTIDWDKTDCIPLVLKNYVTSVPYYIDFRSMSAEQATLANPKFKHAINAIISRFRNVDPNEMLGEEIAQFRRGSRIKRMTMGVVALLAVGFSFTTYFAENQRRRAVLELLESSGRESVLASRDDRPSAGLRALRAAIKSSSSSIPLFQVPLPASTMDAGFLALVEDRSGPVISLELRKQSIERIDDNNSAAPPTSAVFNNTGTMVAAGVGFDAAIWRTSDGNLVRTIQTEDEIEKILFNERGTLLFLVSINASGHRTLTAVDIATGTLARRDVVRCGSIPCLPGVSGQEPLRRITKINDLAVVRNQNTPSPFQYIVPTAYYRGAAADRYHVFLEETDTYSTNIFVIDEVTQSVTKRDVGGSEIAISQGQPILVAGGMTHIDEEGQFFYVYNLLPTNGKLRLDRTRQFYVPHARMTEDLWLDPSGATLHFNAKSVGTGGGIGIRMSGAIDMQNGRLLWSKSFNGSTIYNGNMKVQAQFDTVGSVLNSRDGERIFGFDGEPLVFSDDGSVLLSRLEYAGRDQKKVKANWQLTEIIKKKRFASYDLTPRSIRGECNFAAFPFRQTDNTIGRRWNPHDWAKAKGVSMNTPSNTIALSGTTASIYKLNVNGEKTEVSQQNKQREDVPMSALEKSEIVKRFSALTQAKPLSGTNIYTVSVSNDKRWLGEVALREVDDERHNAVLGKWWIFDQSNSMRQTASGTIKWDMTVNAGNNMWMANYIYFPAGSGLGFVQNSACTLSAVSLAAGKSLGQLELAYTNLDVVERVSDDVIMIGSSDWYGATRVMQLASIPDFRPGPSIVFADGLENDNALDEVTVLPSDMIKDTSKAKVVADATDDELEYCAEKLSIVDSRFLILDQEKSGKCQLRPEGIQTFKLPPWGKRLEAILRAP